MRRSLCSGFDWEPVDLQKGRDYVINDFWKGCKHINSGPVGVYGEFFVGNFVGQNF